MAISNAGRNPTVERTELLIDKNTPRWRVVLSSLASPLPFICWDDAYRVARTINSSSRDKYFIITNASTTNDQVNVNIGYTKSIKTVAHVKLIK